MGWQVPAPPGAALPQVQGTVLGHSKEGAQVKRAKPIRPVMIPGMLGEALGFSLGGLAVAMISLVTRSLGVEAVVGPVALNQRVACPVELFAYQLPEDPWTSPSLSAHTGAG